MNGPTHALLGACAGLLAASAMSLPAWQVACAVPLAMVTSAGHTSPDMDQSAWWRLLDRWLPDELLGESGPMRHRGITHWWGLVVVAGVALWMLAPGAWWAWALLAGWTSHLVGDFLFGANGGIPVMPWWNCIGLGLDVGGPTEAVTRAVVLPVILAVLALRAGGIDVIGPIVDHIRAR